MKLQDNPPVHLTYCLNIHPGESWAENFEAVRTKALKVRERVGAKGPFGLGLRVSNRAAGELGRPEELQRFKKFLSDNGLYVFTINGFPFGTFHGERVKEKVYGPDWRTSKRLEYTVELARILAELLPEGVEGSISTVPGSYKEWIKDPGDVKAMLENLARCAKELDEIRRRTGKMVRVALEPEPDCFIETTQEAIDFVSGTLMNEGARLTSEKILREHVGVCVDTCHQAVQFEDVTESLRALKRSGVRIAKAQLSSALRTGFDARARGELCTFCDPVYLHQARARFADGTVRRWRDLGEMLEDGETDGVEEARVHFHVPLFFEGRGELKSTVTMLGPEFFALVKGGITQHVEIETYTFNVLPEGMREPDVTVNIAREYEWVMNRLAGGR